MSLLSQFLERTLRMPRGSAEPLLADTIRSAWGVADSPSELLKILESTMSAAPTDPVAAHSYRKAMSALLRATREAREAGDPQPPEFGMRPQEFNLRETRALSGFEELTAHPGGTSRLSIEQRVPADPEIAAQVIDSYRVNSTLARADEILRLRLSPLPLPEEHQHALSQLRWALENERKAVPPALPRWDEAGRKIGPYVPAHLIEGADGTYLDYLSHPQYGETLAAQNERGLRSSIHAALKELGPRFAPDPESPGPFSKSSYSAIKRLYSALEKVMDPSTPTALTKDEIAKLPSELRAEGIGDNNLAKILVDAGVPVSALRRAMRLHSRKDPFRTRPGKTGVIKGEELVYEEELAPLAAASETEEVSSRELRTVFKPVPGGRIDYARRARLNHALAAIDFLESTSNRVPTPLQSVWREWGKLREQITESLTFKFSAPPTARRDIVPPTLGVFEALAKAAGLRPQDLRSGDPKVQRELERFAPAGMRLPVVPASASLEGLAATELYPLRSETVGTAFEPIFAEGEFVRFKGTHTAVRSRFGRQKTTSPFLVIDEAARIDRRGKQTRVLVVAPLFESGPLAGIPKLDEVFVVPLKGEKIDAIAQILPATEKSPELSRKAAAFFRTKWGMSKDDLGPPGGNVFEILDLEGNFVTITTNRELALSHAQSGDFFVLSLPVGRPASFEPANLRPLEAAARYSLQGRLLEGRRKVIEKYIHENTELGKQLASTDPSTRRKAQVYLSAAIMESRRPLPGERPSGRSSLEDRTIAAADRKRRASLSEQEGDIEISEPTTIETPEIETQEGAFVPEVEVGRRERARGGVPRVALSGVEETLGTPAEDPLDPVPLHELAAIALDAVSGRVHPAIRRVAERQAYSELREHITSDLTNHQVQEMLTSIANDARHAAGLPRLTRGEEPGLDPRLHTPSFRRYLDRVAGVQGAYDPATSRAKRSVEVEMARLNPVSYVADFIRTAVASLERPRKRTVSRLQAIERTVIQNGKLVRVRSDEVVPVEETVKRFEFSTVHVDSTADEPIPHVYISGTSTTTGQPVRVKLNFTNEDSAEILGVADRKKLLDDAIDKFFDDPTAGGLCSMEDL